MSGFSLNYQTYTEMKPSYFDDRAKCILRNTISLNRKTQVRLKETNKLLPLIPDTMKSTTPLLSVLIALERCRLILTVPLYQVEISLQYAKTVYIAQIRFQSSYMCMCTDD